jgi:hypothetical protein
LKLKNGLQGLQIVASHYWETFYASFIAGYTRATLGYM